MGFSTRGESPLQTRVAKACRKSLQNLKNQFRPKRKVVVMKEELNQNNRNILHGM